MESPARRAGPQRWVLQRHREREMPSGRIVIEPQGEVTRIAGAIDESARLPEVLEHARAGRLVLDLGGVTFIDSLGIRDWIQLQQAARRAGIVVELRRVSEP